MIDSKTGNLGFSVIKLIMAIAAIELLAIIAIVAHASIQDRPSWCDSWSPFGEKTSNNQSSRGSGSVIAEGVSVDQVQIAQADGTYGMLRKGDKIHDLRTGEIYSESEYANYVKNKKLEAAVTCKLL